MQTHMHTHTYTLVLTHVPYNSTFAAKQVALVHTPGMESSLTSIDKYVNWITNNKSVSTNRNEIYYTMNDNILHTNTTPLPIHLYPYIM